MSFIKTDKQRMKEFLQLYKELSCLWNNTEPLYTNKEARDNAYEVLLEKYQEMHDDATLFDVKKKIANMRCSFRKEHKKVLMTRPYESDQQYIPQLWYYNDLLFLEEYKLNTENDESTIEIINDESSSQAPSVNEKKRKLPTALERALKLAPSPVVVVQKLNLPEHSPNDNNLTNKKERHVLTELIQLYKESPCLWDTRDVCYNNKTARDKAFDLLLKKYREIDENATLADFKKKIENMRTSFRREHKKVLLDQEHKPLLWYYKNLLFLNDVCDYKINYSNSDLESSSIEYEGGVKIKKRKRSSASSSAVPTFFLPEHIDDADYDDEDDSNTQYNKTDRLDIWNEKNNSTGGERENVCKSFGKTVGLQLNGLDPMQQLVAEKLISDVIFLARLNKLTVNSSICP